MKWYRVPGYQAEVTKNGKHVRDSISKKIIKSTFAKKKYDFIIVIKTSTNKRTIKGVHQLVARVFIGPCPKGKEVNHKDLDKKNNHYKNLEYLTQSGNSQHTIKNGVKWGNFTKGYHRSGKNHGMFGKDRRGEKNPNAKISKSLVQLIRNKHSSGKYLQNELAKIFKVSRFIVWSIVNKKCWREDDDDKKNKHKEKRRKATSDKEHHKTSKRKKSSRHSQAVKRSGKGRR
jgi:hypothetical protein